MLKRGSKRPTTVRVSILGDESVGKTTLLRTLKSSAFQRFVRSVSSSPAVNSPQYYAERTGGVDVSELDLGDGKVFRCFDFGGQPQFVACHSPLLWSNHSLSLLLLSLQDIDDPEKMFERASYWLSFLISSRSSSPVNSAQQKPGLIVVFTFADKLPKSGSSQLSIERVYERIRQKFEVHFAFVAPAGLHFTINCLQKNIKMERLENALRISHQDIIQVSNADVSHHMQIMCYNKLGSSPKASVQCISAWIECDKTLNLL